jgi:hypothetical protein
MTTLGRGKRSDHGAHASCCAAYDGAHEGLRALRLHELRLTSCTGLMCSMRLPCLRSLSLYYGPVESMRVDASVWPRMISTPVSTLQGRA